MKIIFKSSFAKDLRKVRDSNVKTQVHEIIERAEKITSLSELGEIKKLKGVEGYYRVRVGDYRLGLVLQKETLVFVRFLHRKDIYRYFP